MDGHRAEQRVKDRASVLEALGASGPCIQQILNYCARQTAFSSARDIDNQVHIADESFVDAWRQYHHQAQQGDVAEVLRHAVVQLCFPVRQGMSTDAEYIGVTRKMKSVRGTEVGARNFFQAPDEIEIRILESVAGAIAVVCFANRVDFEYAWQAILHRNEPTEVPASIGAGMIAGYNNLDRIDSYRRAIVARDGEALWPAERATFLADKSRYQDKFIVVSPGPYSGIDASLMQLSDEQWRSKSLQIRIHHEIAHYVTRRLFNSMEMNLHDELIADYMGFSQAFDQFDTRSFLTCIGIDCNDDYHRGGRMEQYTGTIEPGSAAFGILVQLLARAAANVERVDNNFRMKQADPQSVNIMLAMTQLTLEEIASRDGAERLAAQTQRLVK